MGTAECAFVLLALQLALDADFRIMYSSKQNVIDILIFHSTLGFVRFLYLPLFSATFIHGTNNLPHVFL